MVKHARWRLVAATVGLVLLVGCSTQGGSGSSPAGGSTGTPLSREAAGQRYTELVAEPNCAASVVAHAGADLPDGASAADAMAAMQDPAADAAEAYDAFAQGIDDTAWPEDAQSAADAVAAHAREESDAYAALADADDEAAFTSAYDALTDETSGPRPSGALRAALGLDGNQSVADVEC